MDLNAPHPILYSLRHCPYAMRARISLLLAQIPVLLRDVTMDNKPSEMLQASPKGTVPVLVLADGKVLEQSLDIMVWALQESDPLDLLLKGEGDFFDEMLDFIRINDNDFVEVLNRYKAASRYKDDKKEGFREDCKPFIEKLEQRLQNKHFLFADKPSLADYAVLPFVRQFSRVDRAWFKNSDYSHLQKWLEIHFANPIYSKAMTKVPQWIETREDLLLS